MLRGVTAGSGNARGGLPPRRALAHCLDRSFDPKVHADCRNPRRDQMLRSYPNDTKRCTVVDMGCYGRSVPRSAEANEGGEGERRD
jgi:hypothetical protein